MYFLCFHTDNSVIGCGLSHTFEYKITSFWRLFLGKSLIKNPYELNHLYYLDDLQSKIEWSCSFVFQSLSHHQNTAIMGLVCCLLAGDGHGNLQTYCPQFCGNQTFRKSHCLFPGTQLNIYVLLIPVISEHWTDLSTDGWPLLLIFGMGSQLI